MRTLSNFKITAKKSEILAKLKQHRSKHVETHIAAMKGYDMEMRERIDKVVSLAATAKTPEELEALNLSKKMNIDPPRSFQKMFDDAIEMIEFANEENFELDHEKFTCWIKGEFPEVKAFESQSIAYAAKFLGG